MANDCKYPRGVSIIRNAYLVVIPWWQNKNWNFRGAFYFTNGFSGWVLYFPLQLGWLLSAGLIDLIVTAEDAGEENFSPLWSLERSSRRRVKCQHLVKIYSCLDWGLEFVRFSRKNAIRFDKCVCVDVLGNLFRRCKMLHTLPILLQKAEIDGTCQKLSSSTL